MKVEEIIEGLNRFIEKQRASLKIDAKGFFVLQKEIVPHPTFKAYKEYRNNLWYIRGRKKDKIIEVAVTGKVTTNPAEEETIREVNTEFCIKLMELVYTNVNSFIKDDEEWKCL